MSFTGLTVAPSTDANGNEAAFLYNWDGSGTQGDDVYFNVTVGDSEEVYSFTGGVLPVRQRHRGLQGGGRPWKLARPSTAKASCTGMRA